MNYESGEILRENRCLAEVDPVRIEMRTVAPQDNKRTIRLMKRGADGRWDADTLTDIFGTTLAKPSRVKVSERTLDRHYKGTGRNSSSTNPDREAVRRALARNPCKRCGGTGRELHISINAGKQASSRNCRACNRNGRRPWVYPAEGVVLKRW